jgi:hypothetical protein
MDVKGAKALSERLAEAARNVDPPPRKRWVQATPTEGQRSPTLRQRDNCGVATATAALQSGEPRAPFLMSRSVVASFGRHRDLSGRERVRVRKQSRYPRNRIGCVACICSRLSG